MDRDELMRLYEEVGSLRALAKRLGITHTGARYRLDKAGIPVRNSQPRTTAPKPEPTDTDRYLTRYELVHHKNEIKDDNRLENLELMNRSTHMAHHKEGAPRDDLGRFAS